MYTFCGKEVIIKNDRVYSKQGQFLGHLFTDEYGTKHVLGPYNKGSLTK